MANKLTPKQKAFADYYIETGNATEAAIKAGYNKKSKIILKMLGISLKKKFILQTMYIG
jgi:phage terminase small subunit